MMERMLLGVFCLSGWLFSSSSCLPRQYHYVADPMNWTEAQTYCRETYTDLATIENTEEMNQLINTVSCFRHNSDVLITINPDVWIGLYTKINWTWSDGYRGSGAKYRNWKKAHDEPNFYFADQFCVAMNTGGGWRDEYCSLRYPFICYRGTPEGPEFVLVNETMNWSSAQRYCRESFTDLATVRNDTENQEIDTMIQAIPRSWIGLFREPHIYWSDGSSYSFSYWGSDPNRVGSRRVMCGVSALHGSGKWRFLPCGKRLPFVCYIRPVNRQVVKMKIKWEGSGDINDPAVKAAILKQLQDKVKNKGMNGVTLKWREQPDGKVFHKEKKSSQKKRRIKTEL